MNQLTILRTPDQYMQAQPLKTANKKLAKTVCIATGTYDASYVRTEVIMLKKWQKVYVDVLILIFFTMKLGHSWNPLGLLVNQSCSRPRRSKLQTFQLLYLSVRMGECFIVKTLNAKKE